MKYDVFMFIALLTVSAATATNSQEVSTSQTFRPVIVGTPERIAVLENNYIHLNSNLIELKNDFRAGMADIKITLDKQNDQTEKWLLIILAVLMGGDKGLSFMRKLKEGRKVS